MITKLEIFKINEAKKHNQDLIIVDVQESFSKWFPNEEYVENIQEYCEDFTRVFQIYDIIENEKPDYTFVNQVGAYSKEYGGELLIDDIEYYLDEPEQEKYLLCSKRGFNERDIFKTLYNDYFIYIGGQHEWFLCPERLANLFIELANQNRYIILIGGAKNECIEDIYVTLKAFNVNVEYNFDYIFSA